MKKSSLILLILCMLCVTVSFAQQKKGTTEHVAEIESTELEIEEMDMYFHFEPIETLPRFMGSSDYTEFEKWINCQIRYPVFAEENGIQGSVYLEFTITADGSIGDVKILRSIDPSLGKEAVRVIKSSPKWQPAMQNGLLLPYKIEISVIYKIKY